jgi:hypothetical protein
MLKRYFYIGITGELASAFFSECLPKIGAKGAKIK